MKTSLPRVKSVIYTAQNWANKKVTVTVTNLPNPKMCVRIDHSTGNCDPHFRSMCGFL